MPVKQATVSPSKSGAAKDEAVNRHSSVTPPTTTIPIAAVPTATVSTASACSTSSYTPATTEPPSATDPQPGVQPTCVPLELKHNGLHVTAVVGDNILVDFLIDTGCTDTILASWLFESIPTEYRPELQRNLQTIRQANGSVLPNLGSASLRISLGDNTIKDVRVIVADIEDEGLLGMNYLRAVNGKIDMADCSLELGNTSLYGGNSTNQAASCNRVQVPSHLEDLCHRTETVLPSEHHYKIRSLLYEYKDVFSSGEYDIGQTTVTQHNIIIRPGTCPIKQAPYRAPIEKRMEIDRQVTNLLQRGLIEPSNSPWASPALLVDKKDGTQRFCIDYRKLNAATVKDGFPIPRIDDTLDALNGAEYFSTLDLASGYWQVSLTEEARDMSTFCVRDGLYRWKVMPFGLTNAPATFSRLMEQVFRGLQYRTLLTYLDDVVVYSDGVDSQLRRLRTAFERLRAAGLKLKPKKCELFQTSVLYLGHVVSKDGVDTDPKKIEKIENFATPQNVRDVRKFIGLASYYRKFVRDFAVIAQPLHDLMRKNARFRWSEESAKAFEHLKTCLTTAPILGYPRPEGLYILDTDASAYGIGAVLHQVQDEEEKVIAYASKAMSHEEQQYCTTRRELLAIVRFLQHFRHYLYGRKVIVRTDHGSLRWLMNFKQPTGQLARWLERITEYDIEIVYRPGRRHNNADTMSRMPCKQCGQEGTCEQHQQPSSRACTTSIGPAWTVDELQDAQKQDAALQLIYANKEKGNPRPDRQEILGKSRATKYYWGLWDQLELRNGILCKRWESDDGSHVKWQVVIPEKYIDIVLHELHSTPTGGHQGVNRTTARIKDRFMWYGMTADIRSWIRQCNICSMRKPPATKPRAELMQFRPGEPMQIVAMDILGPLPESTEGNCYILVIGEYFTKWVEAFAIPDQQTETIARCLVDQFICRFGVPHQLHSDQGRNFEAQIIQDICTLLGTEKTRTTPYHPSSDGFVERFNSTMMNMVSKLIDPSRRQRDWDEKLQVAMLAYRSTPQTSTGESPHMLMLGRETNMPIDVMLERPLPDQHDRVKSDYARELRNKLSTAYERARRSLGKSAVRQKLHYDKTAAGAKISVGDFVWLSRKATMRGMSKKLDMKWEGPYLVIKQISSVVYRIQRYGPRGLQKVIHYDRLKPYCGKPLQSWLNKVQEPTVVEEEPVLTLKDPVADIQDQQTGRIAPSNNQLDSPCTIDPELQTTGGIRQRKTDTTVVSHPIRQQNSDTTDPIVDSHRNSRFPQREKRKPERYREHDDSKT